MGTYIVYYARDMNIIIIKIQTGRGLSNYIPEEQVGVYGLGTRLSRYALGSGSARLSRVKVNPVRPPLVCAHVTITHGTRARSDATYEINTHNIILHILSPDFTFMWGSLRLAPDVPLMWGSLRLAPIIYPDAQALLTSC